MEDRIIINIDVMLAKRKMSVTELSEKVGITMANISVLKNVFIVHNAMINVFVTAIWDCASRAEIQ